MIKKRNTETGNNLPVSAIIINDNIAKSPQELKTYKDEAIMILNILEKQNIDIYDPNNKPGMYLNRKNKSNIPTVLLKKLKQKSTELEVSNQEQPDLSKLFAHFKNNK